MKLLSIGRLAVAAMLGLTLLVPTAGIASARPGSLADEFPLPNGFQPEGITIGPGPVAYFGSRTDGDIYAADLRTGAGRTISQGPGPGNPSVGLKSDQRRLLYVSGGTAGSARIVSTRTGEILQSYQLGTGNVFINDVVLSKRAAWFTDSRNPRIFRVPLARGGRPAPASAVREIALSGDWEQSEATGDIDANGIALTPDRRALLIVQSNTGFLYRVDARTGVARRVDLGGRLLTNGDGLLVQGRLLYVVQNRLNQVAVVKLDRSGSRGRLVTTLTSPKFDVPTTVAAYRKSLFLPNARFGVANPTSATYNVVRIDAYRR